MPRTALHGIIDRRILVNYRVDPEVMEKRLPKGLRPLLVDGNAMAGICLLRLKALRPLGIPSWLGMSSENAAHRVAVTWRSPSGEKRQGVYIPRRDTDSKLNYWIGGRLFPGSHQLASFEVAEDDEAIDVAMRSLDGEVEVRVAGYTTHRFPTGSVFHDLSEASDFYEGGSVGYSDTRNPKTLDGLKIRTDHWRVEPIRVESVTSSYFRNTDHFPEGSVEFDCALVMRGIPHAWERAGQLHLRDV